MTTHCVIPDVQAKPGQDFEYLNRVGRYIVDKQPDTLICIGDFADMESLSSYDKGHKSFEGRRYIKDIEAAQDAMEALLEPLNTFNKKARAGGKKQYKPRMVLVLGNHENRINRAVEIQPELDGVMTTDALGYVGFGWEVYPFLQVVNIDGVNYSHYFTSGVLGRPVGSARTLLTKKFQSCVQGHVQTMDIATAYRADGTSITALMAGTCYEHEETYLGPQGNSHYRGIHLLYEVLDGSFYHHAVSLNYLKKRYDQS